MIHVRVHITANCTWCIRSAALLPSVSEADRPPEVVWALLAATRAASTVGPDGCCNCSFCCCCRHNRCGDCSGSGSSTGCGFASRPSTRGEVLRSRPTAAPADQRVRKIRARSPGDNGEPLALVRGGELERAGALLARTKLPPGWWRIGWPGTGLSTGGMLWPADLFLRSPA